MMNKIKGPMTASDLFDQTANDPEYQARITELERQRTERWAFMKEAEKPLIADLAVAGFFVDSVWDLVNSKPFYSAAIPILLEHLGRDYPDRIRDGIARALAIREAKSAWPFLVGTYKNLDPIKYPETKDGLAIALQVISDDKLIGEVIDLLRDPKNGESRILLLKRLKKSKLPIAKVVLEELRLDPDLTKEINSWRK